MADDFAWRLEDYFILKRQMKVKPDNAELYHHLGNFYYAHDFEKDGITNWEKAYKAGYRNKIMLVSLYRAYKKTGKTEKAFEILTETYKSNENDPYIFEYYVSEVGNRSGDDAAIKLMENNYDRFENAYSLKAFLMNTYLNNGFYEKLEKLLLNSDIHDTHRISFGVFWNSLKLAKGYQKLKENQYRDALTEFEQAEAVPANIAQHFMAGFAYQARRLFYLGYINSKLGNIEKAEEYWKTALTLTRNSMFEPNYKYQAINTVYYQAFCLKGLGKFDESRNYINIIKEFANSNSINNNPELKKQLLKLSILGLEELDYFARWDS